MVRNTSSRRTILFVALLPACALAGPPGAPSEHAARERAFADGVAALDRADFEAAKVRLATVAAICPVDDMGYRSVLLLAAAELDPRNALRRANVAAELAAFQLARASTSDAWVPALAREIYLLALDFGARPIGSQELPGPRILWTRYFDAQAEPADTTGPRLPSDQASAERAGRPGAGAVVDDEPLGAVRDEPRTGPLCEVPAADPRVAMPELTTTPVVARPAPEAADRPASAVQNSDVRALTAELNRVRAELAATQQELDRIRRTLRP